MHKEHYRHILPHFQQPGQAYFITWCLKNSVPPKALSRYTKKLEELKTEIENARKQKNNEQLIMLLEQDYSSVRRKYMKAFDDLLHLQTQPEINLSKPEYTEIISGALQFLENEKLRNYACCIMPNHVHWVFLTLEKDKDGLPVYVEDIMRSVKRHTANKINELENRKGALWQKESFDVTIRDEKHLYRTIEYTLNNPVAAGMVQNREEWKGSWCSDYGCGGFQPKNGCGGFQPPK